MLDSWEEYTFLAMLLTVFALASLTRDSRLHVGVLTLLAGWFVSIVSVNLVAFVPTLLVWVIVNIVVMYVFLQLHYRREDEEREPQDFNTNCWNCLSGVSGTESGPQTAAQAESGSASTQVAGESPPMKNAAPHSSEFMFPAPRLRAVSRLGFGDDQGGEERRNSC